MVVVRTGGSKWLSALPTGSKWLSALPTGSKWLRAPPGQKGGLPSVTPASLP